MTGKVAEASLELALFVEGAVTTHPLLPGDEILVGREAPCTARANDESVSRKHAALRREGDVVFVRDLGSANGTFVRELPQADRNATSRLRPVRNETTVPVGAILLFGTVLGVVRHSPATAPALVVVDPTMRALHERAARAAGSLISVLLLGETGVGKEVVARAIHDRSPRSAKRFLPLNCGALAPTLVESELFGHEKGAFTGASQTKTGLFEAANEGTVFLDEIGELPLDVQVKLLRVLEERAVMKVGGREWRPVDVRVVSATHRNLEADCRTGRFREDLFFRLDGMSLTIPPLRKRPEEILELARVFLARACESGGRRGVPAISVGAARLLQHHAWPGNVRELRNAMELAAVLCSGGEVLPGHLPDRIREPASSVIQSAPEVRPTAGGERELHEPNLLQGPSERTRVLEALERCQGNQTRAAELLGVSRRTLVSRLTQYGLTTPRKPRA